MNEGKARKGEGNGREVRVVEKWEINSALLRLKFWATYSCVRGVRGSDFDSRRLQFECIFSLTWLDKGITFGWKPSFLDLVSSAFFCCCCWCCLARSFSSASICICSERIRIRIWWIATKWTEQRRRGRDLNGRRTRGDWSRSFEMEEIDAKGRGKAGQKAWSRTKSGREKSGGIQKESKTGQRKIHACSHVQPIQALVIYGIKYDNN